MYATVSYDIDTGPQPIENVRSAMLALFQGRETLDVLADTFICHVSTTADYLELVSQLRQVGRDFPDQFQFLITLHSKGAPLRSNASFSTAKAKQIVDQ